MSSEDEEILHEFLIEGFEGLDQLDQDFVLLEDGPSDPEIIKRIFRTIHTIKGTCGFLELKKLESITHLGETLLDGMRTGEVKVEPQAITVLLSMIDSVRSIMQQLQDHGTEGDDDFSALKEDLKAAREKKSSQEEPMTGKDEDSSIEKEQESVSEDAISEDIAEMLADQSSSPEAPAAPEEVVESPSSSEQGAEPKLSENLEISDELIRTVMEHESEEGAAEEGAAEEGAAKGEEVLAAQEQAQVQEQSEEPTSGDDALSAEQQESEEAGSTQEDTPSSEVDDDIANHDLIAEILASPDFQDPSSEESLAEIPQEETTEGEASAPPPEERTVQPEAEQPQSVVETASPEPIVEQAAEVSSPPEPVAEEEEPSESPKVPPVEAPETKDIQASSEEKESSESKKSSPKSSSEGSPSPRSGIADSTLRVDVRLLDKVMNLVGELVLARNQIVQFTKSESDPALLNTCQRLNIITSELQEGVMKTRMQPIANVWSKFPRVVRDIARSCGKQIRVEMKGQETELDKTILEAIKDPLTHIVRNSADHGIEPPEVREQNGKSPEGTLLLRAYHEGGHVNIEISDDGGGLNVDRIRSKAIEKGVVSQEKIQRMSEPEIHRLIFHAGFSTAEKVTNVSGRGVGMDVVRSNIEKIGGSVDVQSQSGHGTTLKIKIPLTLAIVPALTVSCGDQRFAIPQVSLLELLRVEEGTHSEQLEEIGGSLFYRLRGNLLPLVDLESELEMTGDGEGNQAEQSRDVINIVVLRAENKDFGLLVKTVHDTEEIVVKPLGRQVKDNPVFAGATIMGDGKVALILDVLGIGRRTGIVHENGERIDAHSEEHAEESNPPQSLLLVRVAEKYRMAIPLNEVDRLEEFSSEHVEYAGSRSVVQYRGGILPLISMSDFFKGETERFKEDGELSVVVYSVGDRQVGVVVDQILDIVEDRIEMTNCQKRIGINGSAVIQGSVTDLLDIQAVLEATDPSLVVSSETEERHDVQEAR